MRSRFALASLVPLLLALLPATPAVAAAPAPDGAAATVTLVTGDRVTLSAGPDGRPAVAVVPARQPGRRVDFATTYTTDGVRVVPSDVAHLIPGVLDPRLFDVSRLARAGFGDRAPLIVTGPTALAAERHLPSIGATVVRLPGNGIATFDPANRIWLDDHVHTTHSAPAPRLDDNLARIGAPAAWAAGLSGAGVRVAVLDTGVDATHPDLAGRVAAAVDLTGGGDPNDHNGHGTHVASLVAGSGAAAGGARRGVAFGATMLSAKVLDDRGTGQLSDVVAGLEWAVAQGARVVNLSLSSDAPSTGDDPLSRAIDALSGVLVVASAGNRGPGPSTIGAPGAASSALTVGAVDRHDRLAAFSSRGPRAGDSAVKPELVAPGVDIVAARAAGTGLGEPVDARYTRLSGTSMAAPHVAGAAALLAQKHPQWTGAEVKAALVGSAHPVGAGVFEAGSGRLDLAAAVPLAVLAADPVLSFGFVSYPQAGLPPATRTVTLHNTGDGPVSLDVRAHAPDGMLTATPARVTVPAGSRATLTVTLAVARGGFGPIGGVVTAGPVRIPVGVDKESTRHVVRLRAIDRTGASTVETLATLINLRDVPASPPDPVLLTGGEATVRVRPGFYTVTAAIPTVEGDGGGDDLAQAVTSVTIAVIAEVEIDADRELVLDARTGEPLTAAVSGVDTVPVDVRAFVAVRDRRGNGFVLGYDTSAQDVIDGKLFVQPAGPARHGTLELSTKWRLDAAETTYDLLFAGPSWVSTVVAGPHDLAAVRTTYRAPVGYREARFVFTDVNPVSVAVPRTVPGTTPLRRTEHLTAGRGLDWFQCVTTTLDEAGIGDFCQPRSAYRSGSTVEHGWLRAPLRTTAGVTRTATALLIGMNDLGDSEHAGSIAGYVMSRRGYALHRDGVLLAEGEDPLGAHEVPAGTAVYRLTRSLAQDALPLSTRVETSWTFTAVPPRPGRPPVAVPLLDAAVALPVDDTNHVPAGRPFEVTVTGGATLSVSTDDGATWQAVRVSRSGRAVVPALAAGTALSLRVAAADRSGNAFAQTVVRAALAG